MMMKNTWVKTTLAIAAIFSFRMFGLFMLIPIFTLYAGNLQHATPARIGTALGIYGLSQGILQMPFGILSDRYGRKRLIALGLILFMVGSLIGALTHSIEGMMLARLLQGAGAIGSTLIALLSDLTADEDRTKAMAVIGMAIGVTFACAMIISPAMTHVFGFSSIFYLTIFMGLLGLALLYCLIPTPQPNIIPSEHNTSLSRICTVIRNRALWQLNAGIFFQHWILTAGFYAIPLLLQQQIAQGHLSKTWHVYLPLMIAAFLLMLPLMLFAEKRQAIKPCFISAVMLTAGAQILLTLYPNHPAWILYLILLLYFSAFNFLEAMLPSLISRLAPAGRKGTAMGIYSSSQFLGLFFGGLFAGMAYTYGGVSAVFALNSVITLIWLITAYFMPKNVYFTTLKLSLPHKTTQLKMDAIKTQLTALAGIKEVFFAPSEGTIYLRIDKMVYQMGSAENVLNI